MQVIQNLFSGVIAPYLYQQVVKVDYSNTARGINQAVPAMMSISDWPFFEKYIAGQTDSG